MVRSYALCTVSTGAEGYAPPDYYRTISSKQDAEAFINEIKANAVSDGANSIRERECYHSIDNNLGRVVIKSDLSTIRLGITTVLIKLPESKVTESATYNMQSYYVGYVNDINVLSDNSLEITYIVDWFTTSVLNTWLLQDGSLGPRVIAKQVMYRRLTDGEFKYSDENITPYEIDFKKLNSIKAEFTANGQLQTLDLFTTAGQGSQEDYSPHMYYLRYHDASHDTDYTIFCRSTTDVDYTINPETIITAFNRITDIATLEYNPDNVIFYGECVINSSIVRFFNWTYNYTYQVDNTDFVIYVVDDQKSITDVRHFDIILENVKLYCVPDEGDEDSYLATDYNKLSILAPNGTELFQIPRGKRFVNGSDALTVNIHIAGPINAPYLYFDIISPSWCKNNTKSFSIPLNTVPFYVDSYKVYFAEERQYSMDMRNLQAINDLASGVIGGVNQGAMISAFSRTGVRTGKQAMDKGVIGGGIGILGAGLMFGYQELYANKEATRIEDNYNRNKPDTLAMTGDYPINLNDKAGLYAYVYDAITISNIKKYQEGFGYQTNRVATDVNLDSLEGYVQADVVFYNYGNQRTPNTNVIKKYIKDMFNYGITFTKVVLNG